MPKLVKIESNSAVSNYTPASGHVTAFLAEDNGDIVLKVKKSDGTIAALSGGTDTSDATATAADILSGKTAYVASGKVTGTYSGGGFPLAVVDSYTPAYEAINSLALSGMTDHSGDGGDDLTGANGTYEVTSATASNPPATRVYKHSTASFYLVYIVPDEENYIPGGWCLASSASISDVYSAYLYTSATTLTAGTSTWSSEMGMNYDSVTVGSVSSTHHDPAIVVRAVTAYSATNNQYTFDEETETLIAFEVEPIPHYIYAKSGTSLVGDAIGNEGGNYLLTYIPGHSSPVKTKYGNTRNSYYYYGLTAAAFPTFESDNGDWSVTTHDGVACIYNPNSLYVSLEAQETQTSGKIKYYPQTTNRNWTYCVAFNGGGQTAKKQRIMRVYLANVSEIHVNVDWTAATPVVQMTYGGTEKASYASAELATGWHWAAISYDYYAKELKLYVDGTLRGTATSISFDRSGNFDNIYSGIGDWDSSFYVGYFCELKFYSKTLNATQLSAEYNRVSALWTA